MFTNFFYEMVVTFALLLMAFWGIPDFVTRFIIGLLVFFLLFSAPSPLWCGPRDWQQYYWKR